MAPKLTHCVSPAFVGIIFVLHIRRVRTLHPLPVLVWLGSWAIVLDSLEPVPSVRPCISVAAHLNSLCCSRRHSLLTGVFPTQAPGEDIQPLSYLLYHVELRLLSQCWKFLTDAHPLDLNCVPLKLLSLNLHYCLVYYRAAGVLIKSMHTKGGEKNIKRQLRTLGISFIGAFLWDLFEWFFSGRPESQFDTRPEANLIQAVRTD